MRLLRALPKNVRFIGTSTDLEPINMAFASYESTSTYNEARPSPLIIMHGMLGSKVNWTSLSKAFQKKTDPQRKIIAVDARNHGDSPHSVHHTYPHIAEDVREFLKRYGIEKACLLGHSMGGRAMMYFALKYPNFVDKLIIEDMSPRTTSPTLKSIPALFMALQKVKLPANIPMSTARLNADAQLAKSIGDKGLRSFLLTNLMQKSDGSFMWRPNIPVLLDSFIEHIASFPTMNDHKFDGPVLFVAGGVSDFIQKSDRSTIQQLFPKAEFKVIDGAGHWLHSEKPNEFLQVCLEFLNKK